MHPRQPPLSARLHAAPAALALLVLAAAAVLGGSRAEPTGPPAAASFAPGSFTVERIDAGQDHRVALVSAPAGADPDTPLPVLIALHGSGGGNASTFALETGLAEAADGAIVVFPESWVGTWNAGDCCLDAQDLGVDDVGFVVAIIDRLVDGGRADPERIYLAGFSNGGMLAHAVGCAHPDLIAGVAAVSASLTSPCGEQRPARVLLIHGTADRLVRLEGYDGWTPTGRPYAYPSMDTVVAGYVDALGCEAGTDPIVDGDSTLTDHPCPHGGLVRTRIIDGGGHGWPGNRVVPYGFDVDATSAIVDFLGLGRS